MKNMMVAYDMQSRNKKKMAKGGMINDSAKAKQRPMPEEMDADKQDIKENDSKKSLPQDKWTDNPTVKQAGKVSLTPLSRPKIMGSDSFSVRERSHILEEGDLHGKKLPIKEDSELEAHKMGSDPDMSKEHNNHRKPYAKGGMINEDVSMKDAEQDEQVHPEHLEQDDDQMKPSEEEIMEDHFARGGAVEDDMEQPEDEEQEEHHDSIVAAVMAKMHKALKQASGSHDEDEAEMYAEGGMAGVSTNNKEQPNAYYKANKASLKENYTEQLDEPMDSNEHGDKLHDEDAHDMVSKIRSQMNVKRQFKGK